MLFAAFFLSAMITLAGGGEAAPAGVDVEISEEANVWGLIEIRIGLDGTAGLLAAVIERDSRYSVTKPDDETLVIISMAAEREPPVYTKPDESSATGAQTTPEAVAIAESATEGLTDAWEKACAINRWVNEHIDYQWRGGDSPKRSVRETLRLRRGDCAETATLTRSMLAAVGIRASVVEGVALIEGRLTAHAWVRTVAPFVREMDPTLRQQSVDATHIMLNATLYCELARQGHIEAISIAPPEKAR